MRRLFLATLFITGCATGHEPGDQPPESIPPPKLQIDGESEQGRHLLGNLADDLVFGGEFISASAPASMSLEVIGQRIALRDASGQTVSPMGVVLPASGGSALRIDGIDPTYGYLVRYFDPATTTWRDYCDPSESPYAIAMPGYWTAGRLHQARSTSATFACQISGKAARCVEWGYIPETGPGAGPSLPGWDLNQACIQMAMALYCGPDDTPHTREKTPIVIRDFVAGAQPNEIDSPLPQTPPSYPPTPPPPDNYYYEAAWQPGLPVLCLNHLRWADFDLGGPCPTQLSDPRVDPNARFCEDANLDLTRTTLLNASKTMDIALHRWTSSTGDTVTTAHGYVMSDTRPALTSVPPVGFDAPALSNEGYLLRNLTGTLTEGVDGDVFKVYRLHHANGDSVVGPRHMMDPYVTGYTEDDTADFEGYLFYQPRVNTKPLYLYQNGTDYVTATTLPSILYHKVQAAPIGYVVSDSL